MDDQTEIEMSSQTFLTAVQEQHKTSGPLSLERLRQMKEEVEGGLRKRQNPPSRPGSL